MPFDWGKFNKTIKKKFGGKRKKAVAGKKSGGQKSGSGQKSNAWRAYVGGRSNEPIPW